MRRRALLLACALGAVGVIGLSPQAHASCTSFKIYDAQTRCVEDIACDPIRLVAPEMCPLW